MGTAEVAVWVVLAYTAAGIAVTAIAWMYERVLEQVSQTPLDLVQFSLLSLHPLNGERLALDFGLVLLHAGVIWSAVSVTRLPGVWRTRRAFAPRLAAAAWIAGVAIAVALVSSKDPARPIAPLLVAVAAAGAGSIAMSTLRRRARRAPQSARLVALFLALLVPALAMYPSMLAFTTAAKERLIATQYAPLAASQRQDLQDALYATLGEIDAHPNLLELVERSKDATAPTPDRAYGVWWETELRTYRLTSAVELYGANGRLVSRFALNLPEYTTAVHEPGGCGWDVLDEVLPFGSSQRHVLRASRGICDDRGRIAGAIVVSVMLDYRTLPFIQAQSPYLESLQPDRESLGEGAVGRDVEFVVYGWSRAPIYASGTSVWSLPDPVFQRLVESREPFWATTSRGPVTFRVFFMSDRGGIYALGYPVITLFGHLMNVAELIFLAGVLYLGLVLGATLINAADVAHTGQRPRPAARDSRQLLSHAVSGVPGRRRGPGGHSRDRDPDLLRDAAPRRHRRSGGEDRAGRAAAGRRLCHPAAARRRRAGGARRSDHGAGPARHRSGRQPLRRAATPGDERARPVRLGSPAEAHARRRVSPDRARPAADLRRESRRAAISWPPLPSGPAAWKGS